MYGFGRNEELVGRALSGKRDKVVLATKFGIVRDEAEPTKRGIRGDEFYVRQQVEASLRRLNVDHIDLYYQHRVDPDVPIEETAGALASLVEQGKIRHIGLSEAGLETIRRAHAVHPVTAVQTEWSLWSRDIEDEVVPVCRELGIGLVPYSPLGRGFLTGRFKSKEDFEAGDFRQTLQPRFADGNLERNLAIVEALRALAEQKGVTAGQLALAWVQAQGEDVVPIPGTKRRKYLEENVAAVGLKLTAEDVAAIEAAVPADAVAGERYPEAGLKTLSR
ncbi:aldo/keto reductase [Amycolatopsis oliviviridis]|uniref:Aldo/keto reductase n=1 Tax=Amycolatopsis oliviviridis TaxID=1471590 RepID=A0ABQ3LWM0_9PSEU|nr:aldo/keto reductase [Amycolatopsis oliviviridis]